MDYTSLIWFFAAIYGLFFLIYTWIYGYFERRGIPQFRPIWPIFGNMASLFLDKRPLGDFIYEVYNFNRSARYVGIYNFLNPTLVVRDPELIKDITIKNFDSFVDHEPLVDREVEPLFGNNLSGLVGDHWREARGLLSPALTTRRMRLMFEVMSDCAQKLVDHLNGLNESELQLVDSRNLFRRYTSDVITRGVLGIEVDAVSNPKDEFYVMGSRAINAQSTWRMTIGRLLPPWIMRHFRIRVFNEANTKAFKQAIGEAIEARKVLGIERPDVIQMLIEAERQGTPGLDPMTMAAHAFTFYFGGFSTTSSQMCFIAHELALNPEVHQRLQEEGDLVLSEANGGKVSYDTIMAMQYLDLVFLEALRVHPQAILDRVCTRSYELPPALPGLKPHKLEPGDSVWVPAAGIYLDEEYYPEPRRFDPDRQLGKKINNVSDPLVPGFGNGPRVCFGYRLAILVTKILYFYILANFNIRKSSRTDDPFAPPMENAPRMPKSGFWVKFEKRIRNDLKES